MDTKTITVKTATHVARGANRHRWEVTSTEDEEHVIHIPAQKNEDIKIRGIRPGDEITIKAYPSIVGEKTGIKWYMQEIHALR